MVTLNDLFDMKDFEVMAKEGFVKIQRHPEFPDALAIANYTHKTQQNYHWNAVTEQTRGLIYNPETLEVVARPFRKFYNLNEPQRDIITGSEHVIAYDKLDGSLGIGYITPDGRPAIATRGSFTSEQAVWATRYVHRYEEWFPFLPSDTDLFEIIYPDNRIVVEYGGYEGLVYLGSIEIETGRFTFEGDMYDERAEVIYEGPFEGIYSLKSREGKEGVVVATKDGRRVKVKQEEYVRLHRIVSNLTPRYVWEAMSGPDITVAQKIAKDVPEEHGAWVMDVAQNLIADYVLIATKVSEVYHRVKELETRKDKALAIKDEHPVIKACIFAGLDNRSYTEILWKAVRPTGDEEKGDDVDN